MIARELSTYEPAAAPVYDFTDLLAKRYQQGQQDALEPLLRAVDPLIGMALARARNHNRITGLPPALQHEDLKQEAVIIVAELARRWDPALGSFGGYVRTSLPWELAHAVKRFSASRGTKSTTVLSIDHDQADAMANSRFGDDGRRWPARLALAEALGQLPPLEQRLLALEFGSGLSATAAGEVLALSPMAARNLRTRALGRLQRWYADRPRGGEAHDQELRALLNALIDTMGADGRLQGQAVVREHSRLPLRRYVPLMAELEERGVVIGRSKRRPGSLALFPAAQLLAELGD